MPTLSLEFLLMTTSTLLASWFVVINPAFEVCYVSSRETTSPWLMILRRTRSFGHTRISGAFAAKRSFPPGFIELPITASGKTHGREKNWSGSMNRNGNASSIHKLSTRG